MKKPIIIKTLSVFIYFVICLIGYEIILMNVKFTFNMQVELSYYFLLLLSVSPR